MDQLYLFMIMALFALAIVDLVVGVSNDAVNFLNSAIGSKAVSMKTIMIVASVGVAIGAVFSSGMMEVARSGIFNPHGFYFNEIMVIFMAVMLTDVLLLDLFNSLGLPTSTTVSIVFELLGAAVCVAIIKIYGSGQELSALIDYINTQKATEIIFGILISVVIAFTVGTIVQYISRLIFSFQFERNIRYTGGIFGGVALTALSYFIVFKGLKGVTFISPEMLEWLDNNIKMLLLGCLIGFTILSQLLIMFFRINILKVVIVIGTFGLAMAFAGNDLVNFIGVPIAAWQSFEMWSASGLSPDAFTMEGLAGKVKTPTLLLLFAGGVMVVTLWFSKKARNVIETGINLSRQSEAGKERFEPNFLSRLIVRGTVNVANAVEYVLPKSIVAKVDARFQKPVEKKSKKEDAPAFDLVRAAVNLVVASILISAGTSLKLPLSTTYVTFMVAMGSSLADRAWGRESAVYRVAGVFNVVGGWFVTAFVAFIAAFIMAAVIFWGKIYAILVLIIIAVLLLYRSYIVYRNAEREKSQKRRFDRADLITINEIINESSDNISRVISSVNEIYATVIDNLGKQDLVKLKKSRKKLKKLEDEVDELKSDVFYFIKSLDETSVEASKFYILILDYLQDMVQSIGYIARNSYTHVNNNHKNLKFNQVRDLKGISDKFNVLFTDITTTFEKESFGKLEKIILEQKNFKTMFLF